MVAKTKVCRKCGEEKVVDHEDPRRSEFVVVKSGRQLGYAYPDCKACRSLTAGRTHRPWRVHDAPERRCTRCGETKGRDAFGTTRSGRPNAWCRACWVTRSAAFKKMSYQQAVATGFGKCGTCRKTLAVSEFDLNKTECRRCRRDAYYRAKYVMPNGRPMTIDDYERMLEEQGGGCAVCGTTEPGSRIEFLHVDHCKKTGVVRGLLCSFDNTGLGLLGDDLDGLLRAVRYLARAEPDHPLAPRLLLAPLGQPVASGRTIGTVYLTGVEVA